MAAVSFQTMQQFSLGGADGRNHKVSRDFFVSSCQQILPMHEKPKKTWTQRLKISKPEVSTSPQIPKSIFNYSKPVKYSEPWLYGTVRGIPVQPKHGQAFFSPLPTEVAVVVCSCPEYLIGSKRDVKKASVCKRCKGSRLPLVPIGGTVRVHSTTSSQILPSPHICAGTLKIQNLTTTNRIRPSILGPKNDPYDVMRRSRLISPDLKSIQDKQPNKNRAKSISPSRSRGRIRDSDKLIDIKSGDYKSIRSKSVNRNEKEQWLDNFEPDPGGGRRSILNYNLNPYELNASKPTNLNEFDPSNIEILNDKHEVNIKNSPCTNKNNYHNIKAIAGQRIILGGSKIASLQQTTYKNIENKLMKNDMNDIKQQTTKNQNHSVLKNNEKISNINSKPKRPPRRCKQDSTNSINNIESIKLNSKILNDEISDTGYNQKYEIKSILKRPSSLVSFSTQSINIDAKFINNEINNKSSYSDCSNSDNIYLTKIKNKINNNDQLTTNSNPRKKVQFLMAENDMQIQAITSDCNIRKNQEEEEERFQKLYFEKHDSYSTKNSIKYKDEAVFSQKTEAIADNDREMTNSIIDKDENLSSEFLVPKVTTEFKSNNSEGGFKLRKALSERSLNNELLPLNFNDTMALRIRPNRPNSNKIFENDIILKSALNTKENPQKLDSHIKSTQKNPSTVNVGQSKETSSNYIPRPSDMIMKFPNKISSDIKKSEIKKDLENEIKSKVNESYSEEYKKSNKNISLIRTENDTRFQNQSNNNNNLIQKTVVRVAPFNKLPEKTSEILRLKIEHEDDSLTFLKNNEKKTSILINGDDCYSTVNVDSNIPIYQSSVVVTTTPSNNKQIITSDDNISNSNTVTISVKGLKNSENDIIFSNNEKNNLLNFDASKSVIPIVNHNLLQQPKQEQKQNQQQLQEKQPIQQQQQQQQQQHHGRTLIILDYKEPTDSKIVHHEEELVKILRDPVEAVRLNLIPHICGKTESRTNTPPATPPPQPPTTTTTIEQISSIRPDRQTLIGKLLEDKAFSHLAEGLDIDLIGKLIENSLKRLKKENHQSLNKNSSNINDDIIKLIDSSLNKIKEERNKIEFNNKKILTTIDEHENQSNHGSSSISSGNSYSSANYELFEFDNNESDCYQSCSSETTQNDEYTLATRYKFYQLLVDATLSEIEITTNLDDDDDENNHHYESIKINNDPIYEEINDIPPPLPLSPPPIDDCLELEKKITRSMFEGASKYDILSYLVDVKERGIIHEDLFDYNNFTNTNDSININEEIDKLSDLKKRQILLDNSSRISHISLASDSSQEDISLTNSINDKINFLYHKTNNEVERNDSGVGSETSKTSRNKYQQLLNITNICEDCDNPIDIQLNNNNSNNNSSNVIFVPLVCRKCGKKRAERKEIITEIVETEEKYGRDLQIILEEFQQPILVAGLLTQEQISAIFLNTEELLENNHTLAERMRDSLDIALEQGDDDLLTVNMGKILLESTQMLHTFESYCIRQASASLLLANLEKEKELLRIFLRVSQMENAVLRRMNLNSFLMVPVQRVTKYPLLLARLYKVTPHHLQGRELLKQAQEKIELHLSHMNQEAKDVPTKLWRRISSSSPNRRISCEMDMINIKLRKMAIDLLEWNHDEVRFPLEGKLLFTIDFNWKKGRTIKLAPANSLLVTNGKPNNNYNVDMFNDQFLHPKNTGIKEAALLLVKEKCGRYTLIRDPLYLDRCVISTDADWDDYFEINEISTKDTFIFKAEDGERTKQWYTQLQYHAQGMGAWRKRRNALANIMIDGMLTRS